MSTAKQLTIKDVMRAFDVSHMTVHSWRKGTPTKPEPLPVVDTGTTEVRILASAAKAWAKKYGITIVVPFDKLTADAKKPGPKAKPAATVKVHKRVAARASKRASRASKH